MVHLTTQRTSEVDDQMRALAYNMLGSFELMEDALQEAYLKAFKARERFRAESAFSTWLHTIVYRTCLDMSASNCAQGHSLSAESAGQLADPVLTDNTVAERLLVEHALHELSADHRAVLSLVHIQGLTMGEAATVLGVPRGTVASRLARARTALQTAMDHHDDERDRTGEQAGGPIR